LIRDGFDVWVQRLIHANRRPPRFGRHPPWCQGDTLRGALDLAWWTSKRPHQTGCCLANGAEPSLLWLWAVCSDRT